MNTHGVREDGVLGAIAHLTTYDVSRARAERLRTRCHAVLRSGEPRAAPPRARDAAPWERSAAPALVAVWCVLYVLAIVWQAAGFYGF